MLIANRGEQRHRRAAAKLNCVAHEVLARYFIEKVSNV
jgi:hypothetical protein